MTRPARRTSCESSSSSRSSKREHLAVLVGLAAGAAQHGADAGDDLLEAERLGDVVVAADGEALDLVVDRVARGDEDDRQLAALLAQPPGDGEAVHVGEHHVEDAQVGLVVAGDAQGLGRRSAAVATSKPA